MSSCNNSSPNKLWGRQELRFLVLVVMWFSSYLQGAQAQITCGFDSSLGRVVCRRVQSNPSPQVPAPRPPAQPVVPSPAPQPVVPAPAPRPVTPPPASAPSTSSCISSREDMGLAAGQGACFEMLVRCGAETWTLTRDDREPCQAQQRSLCLDTAPRFAQNSFVCFRALENGAGSCSAQQAQSLFRDAVASRCGPICPLCDQINAQENWF
uniref:Uncharacterized protein n=1 Tax=Tetraselmis sp. GSL018 TaxID=582737 RepID=A0A061R8W9_9CHLO|mmetsp:Transcript_21396/g.51038  ORF Transcript_21396/g.51038 Transcript_21396/m.51038 type:complete len:210 (-) Transcript_21396:241-870(-)|eukprot:CAMPEP_0177597548 /NCGR_PEP_ID=MMETSP0419_2-20121207/11771_1 /TAXON_ID=582737 /ORGANISM="Tetraselmis sp., Strain GSL018" /LENGTH=209 /DNA_ID=CAMNT_0019089727 /DNA_START=148 /DNA_END=777 /DNA_ORIENTATION=+